MTRKRFVRIPTLYHPQFRIPHSELEYYDGPTPLVQGRIEVHLFSVWRLLHRSAWFCLG